MLARCPILNKEIVTRQTVTVMVTHRRHLLDAESVPALWPPAEPSLDVAVAIVGLSWIDDAFTSFYNRVTFRKMPTPIKNSRVIPNYSVRMHACTRIESTKCQASSIDRSIAIHKRNSNKNMILRKSLHGGILHNDTILLRLQQTKEEDSPFDSISCLHVVVDLETVISPLLQVLRSWKSLGFPYCQ